VLGQAGFQARLAEQVAEAEREGGLLGLALFSLELNGLPDIEARDLALRDMARTLRRTVRTGETVGWIGGGLFAWVMVLKDEFSGWEAAERVRQEILGALPAAAGAQISASVCEVTGEMSPEVALWRATVALYWGKMNGTGLSFRWSDEVVALLSEERRKGLSGSV
jgi:GGDEF domain-containing protein